MFSLSLSLLLRSLPEGEVPSPERLWGEYLEFRAAVGEAAPETPSLTDKDRYLWDKSFHDQLRRDVELELS